MSPTEHRHRSPLTLFCEAALLPALLPALAWLTAVLVSAQGAWAAPAHYLVLETDGATVEALFYRQVELAETPAGATEGKLLMAKAHEAEGQPLVWVELVAEGSDGKAEDDVLYRDVVSVSPGIRGEFHGTPDEHGHAPIEGFHVQPQGKTPFVLRLPMIEGASLRLSGLAKARFELDALVEGADRLPLASTLRDFQMVPSGAKNGSSANRADFLIIGDGYTAAQRGKFTADASRLENEMFSITPYNEYRSYTQVSRLFVASAQSGADHPPYQSGCNSPTCCSDTTAQADPRTGRFSDTALDATFCTANIQRLLTVDRPKTLAAASAIPDWDQILVMVNDPTYGGAGGLFAVVSLNLIAVSVMQHEVGHSFTNLADEYETPDPGFGVCRESNGTCEANVTDRTQRSTIKWLPWIRPATPVPTPDNGFGDAVGVFEGARYQSSGQFRPKFSCQMRDLGARFCEVCAQEYVLKLFRGGFGSPAGGIDPIEPGSENPSPGNVNGGDQPVTLSVDLLQPSAGRRLSVSWRVDGRTVSGAGSTFSLAPERAGTYEVQLVVDASTPLVNPQMAGNALRSTRQWTVTSSGVLPPLNADFRWQGGSLGEPFTFSDESAGEPQEWLWEFGDGQTSNAQSPAHIFESPGIFKVRMTVRRGSESATSVQTLHVYPTAAGSCSEGSSNLCVGTGGRFKVEALWRNVDGGTGSGGVVAFGSLDSGLFQFFGENNWELLVKVIDACTFNERFWVFAAATTNVEYALRVTDTVTDSTQEYLNPPGNSSPAITDIEAFATCDPGTPGTIAQQTLSSTTPQQPSRRETVQPEQACIEDAQRLCLLDNRFEVTLDWRDFEGNTGSASLTQAKSDTSGTLWFFTPDNWELLIKVIDACGINNHFWVFGAATTNVEYTLRVRHLASGEVVEYFNGLGEDSAPITDTEALSVCEPRL